MAIRNKDNSFWLSYSDLMTSLFFVMLILFFLCIIRIGLLYSEKSKIDQKIVDLTEQVKKIPNVDQLKRENENLRGELTDAKATKQQLEQLLQLDKQFKVLSESSALTYIEGKKTFVAKDFIGIEIFESKNDKIKEEYIPTVDYVGSSLLDIIEKLNSKNPQLSFQMVIEGNAAIKYEDLQGGTFNPDSYQMYLLSYRRALALYLRWKEEGLDFRKYNTEVLISGSGFNGINRDMMKEENNKRFIIQIIPKISRPRDLNF